jgi:septal ring factor EnvC (AmiA/AmiB activator)
MTSIAATEPAARRILALLVRRTAVIVVVVFSLSVGALAVRSAAVWTAASAPLTVAPISAEALVLKLTDERDRSAALEQQLTALINRTNELSAALKAVDDRIATDARTARDLRDKLASARKKLQAMNRAVR